MQTEAIFENIEQRIIKEINKAERFIYVAVAWLTNQKLYQALSKKAISGCKIYILYSNDEINTNSRIDFSANSSGNLYIFPIGDGDKDLMHNKFCVIDQSIVISGSYNWSYKAEKNLENVVITYEDSKLANQFIQEFKRIRDKYYPNLGQEKEEFPIESILKRLEIIKNFISLEEVDSIRREVKKLENYSFNNDLNEIIIDLQAYRFAKGISKLQAFISNYNAITIWNDPHLFALKLEIKNLENKINAYDNERSDINKTILEFQNRHAKELGELILEILSLQKIKYQFDKAKFQETEKDEKDYRKYFNSEKEKVVFELTIEEKKELKKKFRKATFLCHPDKINEVFKKEAEALFIELKGAYDLNDLSKVNEILELLESGKSFKSNSETISEKDALKAQIVKLEIKLKKLLSEIQLLKLSDAYKTIISIDNWEYYFEETKRELLAQLEQLRIDCQGYA